MVIILPPFYITLFEYSNKIYKKINIKYKIIIKNYYNYLFTTSLYSLSFPLLFFYTHNITSTHTQKKVNKKRNHIENKAKKMVKIDDNIEQTIEQRVTINRTERVIKYVKSRLIGKGGFAKVYEFFCLENGKTYAGKVIQRSDIVKPRHKRKLITEIQVHRSLNHRNIVKFEQSFSDEDNYYIVEELCQHKTLADMIRHRNRISENEARYWLSQLLRAMFYMQESLVLHRDLKLANLFIADGMILKVGDFGLSAKLISPTDRKKSVCGTPNYIAPEILESHAGHGFEADVWSFGVILYTLLIGYPPFDTSDVKETYSLIKKNEYSFPKDVTITEEARDLIQRILVQNPEERYTLSQIASHPFFMEPIPPSLPLHSLITEPSYMCSTPARMAPALAAANANAPYPKSPNDCVHVLLKREDENPEASSPSSSSPEMELMDDGDLESPFPGSRATSFKVIPDLDELSTLKHALLSTLEKSLILNASKTPKTPLKIGDSDDVKSSLISKDNDASSKVCYIKKWYDHSEKYGLAYLLSNNTTGAYFNDTTKITLTTPERGSRVNYLDKTVKVSFKSDIVSRKSHPLPHDMEKKVKLIKLFRYNLYGNVDESAPVDADAAASSGNNNDPFVMHYYRLATNIIFRFSNGVMQVNFNDHTKVLIVPWWKNPVQYLITGDDAKHYAAEADENLSVPPEMQVRYIENILHIVNKLIKKYSEQALKRNALAARPQEQQQQQPQDQAPKYPTYASSSSAAAAAAAGK